MYSRTTDEQPKRGGRLFRWAVAWVGLVVVCAGSSPAYTQEKGGTDKSGKSEQGELSDEERAQKAFKKGVELYTKKEFAKSIVEFKMGYNLVENPVFLHNTAMAQMHLGRFQKMLETTNDALQHESLEGKARAESLGLNRGSRRILKARGVVESITNERQDEKEKKKDVAVREPDAPARKDKSETARAASTADRSSRDSTASRSRGGDFGTLGWLGVASGALGGGMGAAASVIGADVANDIENLRELRREPGKGGTFQTQKARLQQKQTIGKALLFSAGGLVTAGGTLLILEMAGGTGSARKAEVVFDGRLGLSVRW